MKKRMAQRNKADCGFKNMVCCGPLIAFSGQHGAKQGG